MDGLKKNCGTEFKTNETEMVAKKNRINWKYSFARKEAFPMFSSVAVENLRLLVLEGSRQQGHRLFWNSSGVIFWGTPNLVALRWISANFSLAGSA